MDFNDPHFKSRFWEWFDSLSRPERQKFQLYHSDMAELFFYNKIYRYGVHDEKSKRPSKSPQASTDDSSRKSRA